MAKKNAGSHVTVPMLLDMCRDMLNEAHPYLEKGREVQIVNESTLWSYGHREGIRIIEIDSTIRVQAVHVYNYDSLKEIKVQGSHNQGSWRDIERRGRTPEHLESDVLRAVWTFTEEHMTLRYEAYCWLGNHREKWSRLRSRFERVG
jgi:hypothetical protein